MSFRMWLTGVLSVGCLAFGAASVQGKNQARHKKGTVASKNSSTNHQSAEPKRIAVAYLKALSGSGDDDARSYLLGGVTLTAEDVTIPAWYIDSEEVRIEDKAIQKALKAMKHLDEEGRKMLTTIVNMQANSGESMAEIDQAGAEKLLTPTKKQADRFQKNFPVFAYAARVGKDVYWHPANPWRSVVKRLGKEVRNQKKGGDYHLVLHLFTVVEQVPGEKERRWPLRVLRIRTKGFDSGWKILPASDWDPEY